MANADMNTTLTILEQWQSMTNKLSDEQLWALAFRPWDVIPFTDTITEYDPPRGHKYFVRRRGHGGLVLQSRNMWRVYNRKAEALGPGIASEYDGKTILVASAEWLAVFAERNLREGK